MARIKRRPRVSHPIAELNVTNMIDLGFVLLIIFMTCTVVSQQEQSINVDLPKDDKKEQIKPAKDTKFVSITIDKNGVLYLDGANVTWTRLCERLKDYGALPKPKQPVISVRGDGKVQYEKIVAILGELEKYDLTKLSIATQVKE